MHQSVSSGEAARLDDLAVKLLAPRPLDKIDAQSMAGTEDARAPFWSADSRSIGFFASGKLKRVDIAGRPPQLLTTTSSTFKGTWNANGNDPVEYLRRIGWHACSLGRGAGTRHFAPTGTNRSLAAAISARWPPFPFYATGRPEMSGIYLASLDEGEPKRLAAADDAAAYLAPEMIVFVRGTTLMAQHLDMKR